ncbi:MAG TPA: NAD(P)H-dependent glycerol-3-phosphate dehydrogenase [Thermodesulfobacteriota bacterium]|nr:NAD(P)H-dependent glycerol-3-phosphate dehydrogenase [Thermodesulfobacteriota bacterium]
MAAPSESLAISVIGGGSWGTALANLLAETLESVFLWVYEEELVGEIRLKRENPLFLPGIRLLDPVTPTHSLEEAFGGKSVIICVVPSHALREVFRKGLSHAAPGTLIVSATKGLEETTHRTASQILREIGAPGEIACLSGPSFAREVSRKLPTAVASAASAPEAAQKVQEIFNRPYFRVYTNTDMIGVELGGAVKNVMAIAAGVSDGLGFGHNSRAALISRALSEMTRLGVALGARRETFSGLAGLGDLVLTCTGDLSRNRQVGLELGRGKTLGEIQAGTRMVAEGVRTAKALRELANQTGVEMPITEQIYRVLYEGKKPAEAVRELMSRGLRSEGE